MAARGIFPILLTLFFMSALRVSASGAELAPCATEGTWTRYDTAHFTLYSNATAEAGTKSAKQLENFAAMLDARSPGLEDRGGTRVVAFGFASKGDYGPFRPQFQGKTVESVGVFLSGRLGKYLVFTNSGRPEDERTIYHEYLHSLVFDRIGGAPPCVNEGLADFFSTFALAGEEARFGDPIPAYCWILQHETPLTMDQLFGIGHDSEYFGGEHRDMIYAESWALVHYLVRHSSSAEFERFAALMQSGMPAHDAFLRVYPSEDWGTLHTRLRAYADPGELDNFHIPLGAALAEARVDMRPAPRTEILTALGDLLLQERRVAPAEGPAYYRAALAIRGDDPAAVRGLAVVNEVRGFPREADQLYRRAAAAPGADAPTLGLCAHGLARVAIADSAAVARGDSAALTALARARDIAGQALRLDPTEPRALELVCAGVDDDSAFAVQSLDALEKAHAKYPNRTVVTSGLIRAYARTGLRANAEAVFASDARLPADVEARDQAARAIEQAGLREAHELMRAGKVAEGAALMRHLRETTAHRDFSDFLDAQLQNISEYESSNQWVDRYNEGVRALQAGKLERALEVFQDVHDKSTEPDLVLKAGKRLEELRAYRARQSGAKRR